MTKMMKEELIAEIDKMRNVPPLPKPFKSEVIDAFHVRRDDEIEPIRIYPGSGNAVPLAQLGEKVFYVGSNISMDDNEYVDVVDGLTGNWTSASLAELFASPVWWRLSEAAQTKIKADLPFSYFAREIDAEVLRGLPGDVATACLAAAKGANHA